MHTGLVLAQCNRDIVSIELCPILACMKSGGRYMKDKQNQHIMAAARPEACAYLPALGNDTLAFASKSLFFSGVLEPSEESLAVVGRSARPTL